MRRPSLATAYRPASIALALLAAAPLGALAGCYEAEFDELASGLYTCSVDADCNSGFRCIDEVCIDDLGPSLEVTGPELLQVLPEGDTEFMLAIRTERLDDVVGGSLRTWSVLVGGLRLHKVWVSHLLVDLGCVDFDLDVPPY